MKSLYEQAKCEANTCAITGASAFFCGIKDSVIIVNGSGFCYRKMLNALEHAYRVSLKKRVFCAELNENSIIYGNEKALIEVLQEVKKKCKPSVLFIQNNCAGSLIGDDLLGIARSMDFTCPIVALDTGGIKGTFNDGYALAAKALFQSLELERSKTGEEESRSFSVNLLGVTRAYYNFSADCQELKRLLELVDIKINCFVADEMTLEQAKTIGQADLNIVIHEELGGALADYLKESYKLPILKLEPPYGVQGSKAWLQAVCQRLDRGELLLKRLEVAFEPYLKEQKYYLQYFKRQYGDIWISQVNIAGPKSVVKGLAKTLRKEYLNYESMHLFSYQLIPLEEQERFYTYHDSFAAELVQAEESCLLLGSYYEQVELKRHYPDAALGYACIANPAFNYINLSPLMGLGGARHLVEMLWQYYLDYSIIEYKRTR